MKHFTTLAIYTFLFTTISYAQTIYSFGTVGGYPNPGWISSSNIVAASVNLLNFQTTCGFVSTNDLPAGTRYANSQITTYTSPVINTTCLNASTARITLNGRSTLEDGFDWFYFLYSIDGGTTWINPVALSPTLNLSGINLGAFPPLTNYVNTSSNRNGWTATLSAANYIYTIPTSANTRFRFLFESNATGNFYTVLLTNYDRYFDVLGFDVVCNVTVPVELKSFTGKYESGRNVLRWETETEHRNDYFRIDWTADPASGNWKQIGTVNGAGNSESELSYNLEHALFERGTFNYYRLTQVDVDGTSETFETLVVIDNKTRESTVVRVLNLMGQEVNADSPGVVILIYEDGTTIKKCN